MATTQSKPLCRARTNQRMWSKLLPGASCIPAAHRCIPASSVAVQTVSIAAGERTPASHSPKHYCCAHCTRCPPRMPSSSLSLSYAAELLRPKRARERSSASMSMTGRRLTWLDGKWTQYSASGHSACMHHQLNHYINHSAQLVVSCQCNRVGRHKDHFGGH